MSRFADPGLSISEFAEIVGACAAIVLLAVGGIEYRIRKLKGRLDAAQTEASQQSEKSAMLSLVVERGLAGTINSLDFIGGLVQRLAQHRTHEVSVETSMKLLSELRSDVERSWAEARLLTGREAAQLSALQQLAQRLGDEGTTRLLERGASARSFGALESEAVLSAAVEIQKRADDAQPGSGPTASSGPPSGLVRSRPDEAGETPPPLEKD